MGSFKNHPGYAAFLFTPSTTIGYISIPRRTDILNINGSVDDFVVRRYQVDEFREVKPGVWFPTRGTVTYFARPTVSLEERTPQSRFVYTVDPNSVKVAQAFGASDFKPGRSIGQVIRYRDEGTAFQYIGTKENGEDIMMPLKPITPQTQPTP